ncbi:MAG: hypothetical protein B7Y45_14200 [Sphingomonas sp. 28-66-16]|nr:MAG: hypothetical protein B7Y45_14200 [Sphingomonas sp. 28-66-16]
MTTRTQMIEALDGVESVAARLAEVASRTDARRKSDLIEARRDLAIRTMAIMALGERYRPIADNDDLYAELRRRQGHLRATIAEHQSAWSAPSIDSDDAAYVAASAAVQSVGRDFMRWVRQTIESLPEA